MYLPSSSYPNISVLQLVRNGTHTHIPLALSATPTTDVVYHPIRIVYSLARREPDALTSRSACKWIFDLNNDRRGRVDTDFGSPGSVR